MNVMIGYIVRSWLASYMQAVSMSGTTVLRSKLELWMSYERPEQL